MLPLNPWEHQNAVKALYAKCVEAVCARHEVTRMELDILLFLANNPCFDTAKEMVEVRYLSKSQVSDSIRLLEERGCLRKEYEGNNRKTIHLKLCPPAEALIRDGREAQERFLSALLKGFSREEIGEMKGYNDRMWSNIVAALEEE